MKSRLLAAILCAAPLVGARAQTYFTQLPAPQNAIVGTNQTMLWQPQPSPGPGSGTVTRVTLAQFFSALTAAEVTAALGFSPAPVSGTPVAGNCAQWVSSGGLIEAGDAGAPCESVASGTGPAIAQYPAGTSTGVGPATVSGDATIAQGGALTLRNTGTPGTYGAGAASTIAITTDQAGRVSGVSVYSITPGAIGAQPSFTSSAGQIITNNGGVVQGSTASGDATISGTGAVTLATVNSNAGACGDSSHVCQTTSNGKGLTTAATPVAVTPASIGAATTANISSAIATAIPSIGATAPVCGSGAASAVAACGTGMALPSGTVVTAPATADNSAAVPSTAWVKSQGYSTSSGPTPEGNWNASTNTPTLTSSSCVVGQFYYVSVAGATTLNGVSSWNVGDQAVCSAGPVWIKVAASAGITALTGDVTATGTGSVAATLATVNGAPGTTGGATAVAQVNVNGKGLTTSTASVPIAIPHSQITDWASQLASFAFTSPTLSTPAAYGDAGAQIPNDAWAQSNFISQYENNPACIGIFNALSGVPVPCAADGLIYVLSNQQFYTFTQQATPVTTGAQSGVGGSITVVGTSPYYVAGAYVTNATYITNNQTTVTTISGTPTVSGGNTTFSLSNNTISAIPNNTTLTVSNYVVQPQPGQNITCGSPGCIPSTTLPTISTTVAGVGKVDGVIFAAPGGVISCVVGKCLTPDGISVGANAAGTLLGLTDQPVCGNLSYMGDSSPTGSGSQISTRTVLYCPNGAKSVRLLLTAGYVNLSTPPAETAGINPVVWNLSIEPNLPAPWNSTTTYTGGSPGTCVSQMPTQASTTGYTNNPIYCALTTNTNSPPTPSNTNWAAGISQQVVPMTCNGGRPCTLHTSITATGTLQTDGTVLTDPVPVNVPAGGYIAVRGFAAMQAGQITAMGPAQKPYAGSYSSVGASRTDNTLSGGIAVGGAAAKTVAYSAIGQAPTGTPVPTVCYIGDARAESASGSGLAIPTIVSGGSAYTNSDIGAIVSISNTGASSGAAITTAQLMIQNVSGGAVTAVGVYEPGHYSIAGLSGGTLPSGTQTTSGGGTTGSGLTVSFGSYSSGNSGLYENPTTLAPGGIAQGLAAGGVPYTGFAHALDSAAAWTAQGGDSARLTAIKATGCSSALIALGLQDVATGATAATLEANLSMIANQLLGLGTVKAVYIATMPPATSSTDGWATVTNQSLGTGNAVRVLVNDWARGSPAPFSGYVDLAAPVEVNTSNAVTQDGGYILTNASKYYVTPDGTNFTPTGYGLEAAVVSAYAASPGFK